MVSYLYLHGFASSPSSTKARRLSDRLGVLQIPLIAPDLNQGDFSHLTITRQIQQVQAAFPPQPEPVVLIGSSLGGLTAAWLAETNLQVERLVLLAPAFEFLAHWLPKLSVTQLRQWQSEQFLPVYHYAEGRSLPLHYGFVQDAMQYRDAALQREVPTLILHGLQDEVIPIEASRNYAATRPWVKLIELQSDHALGNVEAEIWQAICQFCAL